VVEVLEATREEGLRTKDLFFTSVAEALSAKYINIILLRFASFEGY
jgi:hypothetical protein